MKWIKTIIFIIAFSSSFAQSYNFDNIKGIIKNMSDRDQRSIISIANFVKTEFNKPEDQLKAAFYWTATRIDYATEQLRQNPDYASMDQLITLTMKTKRGLCQSFAEVFNKICHELGFNSYVISGYTRQSTRAIRNTGHAWNAVRFQNRWYLFDPTWSAGYFEVSASQSIRNSAQYKKVFSSKYYKVMPEEFITDHMPFDPIWQLSNTIIDYSDFDSNREKKSISKSLQYINIINQLPYLTESNQIQQSINRIESLGSGQKLVKNNLQVLRRNLDIYKLNLNSEKYNNALTVQLKGLASFNEFIKEFNNRRTPNRKDLNKFKQLLDEAYHSVSDAKNLYETIITNNETLQLNVRIRYSEIEKLVDRIVLEKKSLAQNF